MLELQYLLVECRIPNNVLGAVPKEVAKLRDATQVE
jgi:hypothetical protein